MIKNQMRIISILVLTFICFLVSIHPQKRIDTKIQRGLDAIYNFDWAKGEKIFSEIIEEYPENPSGYHYASIPYLWFYLGSFNEAYLDTFFSYSDKSLDLAKKMESIDTLTAELSYILGAIYSNRSIANARSGSYVGAVWASDRMKMYHTKALELNDKLYDANFGLGLYNLAISQIPSSLQWAVQLVGVNADRETGIDHLLECMRKGKLTRIDAQFYLSQIYTRIVIETDEAKKLLNELNARYPRNLLFKMSLAWIELETGSINSAEKRFISVINSEETRFPLLKSLSYYQLANIYFYKGLSDTSKAAYKLFLESALNRDYSGIANLNLGIIYEIEGNRDSAEICYKNSLKGNSDLDEDSYAKRKGRELLKSGLSRNDIRLINFNNLHRSANYKLAVDSLKSFLKDTTLTSDQRAEANILIAQSNLKTKNYREALKYSVETIKTEISKEKWIHPFAHYYAAVASYNLRNYVDSQLFINLIKDYSDFDFQLKLEGLVYSLQRRLDRLEVKSVK